jgi:PrtD family type I secretion system ABC transporter
MDKFLRYCRRYFIYAGIFSLFINLLMLTLPLYMLQIFDRVLSSRSGETLFMLTIAALGALLLHMFLDILRGRLLLGAGVALDAIAGPPVLKGVLAEMGRPGNTYVVSGLRDVAIIRGFLTGSGITSLFDAPWAPIFIIVIYFFHPLLGVMATLGAVALFTLAYVNEKITRDAIEKTLQESRRAGRYIDAGIRNAEVVNALGMRDDLCARWQDLNSRVIDNQVFSSVRSGFLSSLSRFTRLAIQIIMLSIGAALVIRQEVSPGIMMAGTLILARGLAPIEHSIITWRGLVDARAAYERLKQLLQESPQQEEYIELPAPTGRLQAQGITFQIPGSDRFILKGVSINLEPGESMGLIGPSAAGKSTMARLITGIWRPTSGFVRLDGADVSNWPREDLGPHIGYLPQDVELFVGTVGENISRLCQADDEKIIEAAKRAYAHGMIKRLPKTYNTNISEAGAELSSGQRQRIGLARAMFGEVRLVVLDEPNANLDSEGEEALIRCLNDLKRARITAIIISHRPSLLANVDKLLVLRDGQVDLFGPREEVMARLTVGTPIRSADKPVATVGERSL